MKPIICNERATFERKTIERDLDYGTEKEVWVAIGGRWVETQDVLPSRGESTANGLRSNVLSTRLRMRKDSAITAEVRVTLHGKGDRVMQIISGPALMDDRVHSEYMLEGYHG